jgi:TatD DNase family protein
VTYRNAADVAAASDLVPLEQLMVETDSPYLTPEPLRGERPNQPANVVHVARFLASRRGLSLADFETATDATARRVFGLPSQN